MNVSLTPELESLVKAKVDSGMYSSASEVIREALRMQHYRELKMTRLKAELQKGLDDLEAGRVREIDMDTFFEEVIESIKSKRKETPG